MVLVAVAGAVLQALALVLALAWWLCSSWTGKNSSLGALTPTLRPARQ